MSFQTSLVVILCFTIKLCYSSEPSYPQVNPGCPKSLCNSTNINLLYSRFDEANSSLHYLWSSTGANGTGSPAFFIAESSIADNFTISWDDLLTNGSSGSVSLDGFTNAIGVVITKVFMFNDTNNDGALNQNSNGTEMFDWSDFDANDISKSLNTVSSIQGHSASFNLALVDKELKVNITVFASNDDGRYKILPSLLYTHKSIHVEAVISGGVNNSLTNQRVGLELAVVHVDSPFNPVRVKTIDDEYSPGVFSRFITKFEKQEKSSFVDWKPVGYAKNERIVAHTIDANLNIKDNATSADIPSDNLPLYAFFSNQNFKSSRFNITFGSTKENFYKESNFTSFAFVVGLDDTPQDELSFLVEMIILVGFGLPVVCIVVAALYLVVKRFRRSGDHEPILSNE